jgi:Ca2+-binding EF-hand superfamily protein
MGSKGSKAGGKDSKLPDKPLKLTDKDVKTLSEQTGMSKDQIEKIFQQFVANNPDGKLDVTEFNKLYQSLRTEPVANLDEIDDFVFRAFDVDNNGFLTFNEFLAAYTITTKGDVKQKLQYAFELYDADNNGWLSVDEVKQVISAMLDLLGADKKGNDPAKLTAECLKELDASSDGKISKGKLFYKIVFDVARYIYYFFLLKTNSSMV